MGFSSIQKLYSHYANDQAIMQKFKISDTLSVWCVGSSLVKRAFIAARDRPGGINLGLQRNGIEIWWQGYGGMKLDDLPKKLRTLVKIGPSPYAILIHCGGNDIGRKPVGDLYHMAKRILENIHHQFPSIVLIWSGILPRLQWRYSQNIEAMNKCRKRLNSVCAKTVLSFNGGYIKYPDIGDSTELFSDGVHLSTLGNEIFLNGIQGGIEYIISHKHSVFPPTD